MSKVKYDKKVRDRSRVLKLKLPVYAEDTHLNIDELKNDEVFTLHMKTLSADDLLEFARLSSSSILEIIPFVKKVMMNNVFDWNDVKLSHLYELEEDEEDNELEFDKEALEDLLSKKLHIFQIVGLAIEKANVKKKKD